MSIHEKTRVFIAKLQALPEESKKKVFIATMGVVVVCAVALGIIITLSNVKQINDSLTYLEFPQVEFPDFLPNTSLEELISEGNQGVINSEINSTDVVTPGGEKIFN